MHQWDEYGRDDWRRPVTEERIAAWATEAGYEVICSITSIGLAMPPDQNASQTLST